MVLAAILGPTVQAVELDQQCSVVEQHCNENPIYVFPEKELCSLSPNLHIDVIGPHIFLQQNRQIDGGNI
jgi:hypothetical protein